MTSTLTLLRLLSRPLSRSLLHPQRARSLLWLLLLSLVSTWAVAQSSVQEAPMLAERVAAGELPAVVERLPQMPMVVEPLERVGDYGGQWRTALLGGADGTWLSRTVGYEGLVRVDPEWTEIIPNIAESYEVSDDATLYTFRLREGMKWSDGVPLTADAILFWYEDVFLNEELTPQPLSWLTAGDEVVRVEKQDDYTVTFRFAEPNSLFLPRIAGVHGTWINPVPRHYMAQFHPAHNPDVSELVRQSGLEDWVALFNNKNDVWGNAELPSLFGWVATEGLGENTSRFVVERNPYYFKTDTAGNQLPYIDRVVYDLVQGGAEGTEALLLKALNGEIDMMDRHIASERNKAVFFDNMERGDYRFFETIPSGSNTLMIALNMTSQDPVKREVFQNKDVRIGLSYAIDRQEIIDLLHVGQGEPWQAAPLREAPFYNERLAKQYTEYDVELANEHLDRAFPERDAQGFRIGPDGQRISVVLEAHAPHDQLELIQGYWQAVGVDTQVRVMDRSLFTERVQSNQHEAAAWFGGAGLLDAMMDTKWYFPSYWESLYAPTWHNWYVGAPNAEEPPEAAKQQMALFDQLKATADEARQLELMAEILDIAADEFYAIGISLPGPGYGIVKNNFRNVPQTMFSSGWAYNNPAPTNPEQYFIATQTATQPATQP